MITDSIRSLAVLLDSLHPDPANVRRHPEKNLTAIKSSLTRFGQQKPIVVDANGVIVAGNGTWEAAKALGWTEIAAIRTDLAGPEAVAFAIADNRTAELATWDNDALGDLLRSLEAQDIPAELLGFDQDDLAQFGIMSDGEPAASTESQLDALGFGVIITCKDEAEQAALLQEFDARGLHHRAVSLPVASGDSL